MPQQSYYVAYNASQAGSGGGTYAPAIVLASSALAASTPASSVATTPSQVVPVELDTRAVVLGTSVTGQGSAFTVPNRGSDVVIVRSAPVVFAPVDAGSGGS